MRFLQKLVGVTMFFSSWYIKNKYAWAGNLIYPLSFYLILSLIGGARMSNHAIIGALISSIWMSGVGYMPQFLFSFKFRKLKDMFVSAPIHPLCYMFGAAISVLVSSIPSLLILFSLTAATLQLAAADMVNLATILIITWILSSCLGFVVAGYINDPTKIGSVAPYTGALLTTFPPVYYPLEAVPSQYRIPALLAPTTHVSQLARLATKISTPILHPLIHIGFTLTYLAAFIILAGFKSRWRET